MRILAISICLFICMFTTATAQEIEFADEVKTYLLKNGTANQYEYAYDGLLKMLQNQYPKADNNKEGWVYLNENKMKSVNEMMALLVPVYQKHFERSEIKLMTDFYKTETGQQLMNDRSQMSEAQKQELNAYYSSQLGKKVIDKQEVLSQEISKISEDWSRDLYETAVSLLK